jgi:hypothetical protein
VCEHKRAYSVPFGETLFHALSFAGLMRFYWRRPVVNAANANAIAIANDNANVNANVSVNANVAVSSEIVDGAGDTNGVDDNSGASRPRLGEQAQSLIRQTKKTKARTRWRRRRRSLTLCRRWCVCCSINYSIEEAALEAVAVVLPRPQ